MPGGESHGVRSHACVEKWRRQTVAHKEKHQKTRPGNDFPRAGFLCGRNIQARGKLREGRAWSCRNRPDALTGQGFLHSAGKVLIRRALPGWVRAMIPRGQWTACVQCPARTAACDFTDFRNLSRMFSFPTEPGGALSIGRFFAAGRTRRDVLRRGKAFRWELVHFAFAGRPARNAGQDARSVPGVRPTAACAPRARAAAPTRRGRPPRTWRSGRQASRPSRPAPGKAPSAARAAAADS